MVLLYLFGLSWDKVRFLIDTSLVQLIVVIVRIFMVSRFYGAYLVIASFSIVGNVAFSFAGARNRFCERFRGHPKRSLIIENR